MITFEKNTKRVELRKETYEGAKVHLQIGSSEVDVDFWTVICEELGANYDDELIIIEEGSAMFIGNN